MVRITRAVPLFTVANMEKSVAFYVDGLGFEMQHNWVKDGELRWCWLQRDDSALMLETRQGDSASHPGGGFTLYFICDDAKAAHREFKARGVQVGDMFVGNKMDVFYFKDPDGYRLSFESPIDRQNDDL